MNKIQATLLCIISAAAGTAILCMDHADNSWIGRVVMCYALVIMFAFIGYYSEFVAELRVNSRASCFMVELSAETIETLEEKIYNTEIDGNISDSRRKQLISTYRNCIDLIDIYDKLPPLKAIDEVINNCWYMAVVSIVLLLINIAWFDKNISTISTLILMVIYVAILTRSIIILRGKNDGKGKTTFRR